MTAQPGLRGSPDTHSRTGNPDFAERRVASNEVKIGGICWAITMGTGRSAGRVGNSRASASGPPVETPIATTCTGVNRRGFQSAAGWHPDRDRVSFWQMAERMNSRNELPRNCLERLRHVPIAGFGDVVRSSERESLQGGGGATLGERVEHDDRNMRVDLAQRRTVSRPSISGISISSRTMSGLGAGNLASANRPLQAVPATSRAASCPIASESVLRTTTASSTMRTRFLVGCRNGRAPREQVFARVGQLFEPRKAQESAASLDSVDGAENAGQQLFGGRIGLQFHEFLVQPIQVLVAFDEKIFNDFVHKFCLPGNEGCDASPEPILESVPRLEGELAHPAMSLRHIGVRREDFSMGVGVVQLWRRRPFVVTSVTGYP
jgi:hypothetical protein